MNTDKQGLYRVYRINKTGSSNAYTTGREESWTFDIDRTFEEGHLTDARRYVVDMNMKCTNLPEMVWGRNEEYMNDLVERFCFSLESGFCVDRTHFLIDVSDCLEEDIERVASEKKERFRDLIKEGLVDKGVRVIE